MENIYIVIYLFGLLGYLTYNKHLLVILLIIEFMVLGLILEVGRIIKIEIYSWIVLFLIFILVCERVIGIRRIILLSRSHRGDKVEGISIIKC